MNNYNILNDDKNINSKVIQINFDNNKIIIFRIKNKKILLWIIIISIIKQNIR